jgi:hypothetical protein
MYGHKDLHWKDNGLYLGTRLTGYGVVQDERYPSMWRVRYPDGSLSDIVNRTRARDGARCLALAVLNIRERDDRNAPERLNRPPLGVGTPSTRRRIPERGGVVGPTGPSGAFMGPTWPLGLTGPPG